MTCEEQQLWNLHSLRTFVLCPFPLTLVTLFFSVLYDNFPKKRQVDGLILNGVCKLESPSLCAENLNVRYSQKLFVKHAGFFFKCCQSALGLSYLLVSCWLIPNVEGIFHFSYQICEFMYERELRYDKIIGCYLRDPVRKVSRSGVPGPFLPHSSAARPAQLFHCSSLA